MNKIRTIIVDDEPLALGLLSSYLKQLPQVELVAQCVNGKEAISAVAEFEPDLMFLDIQMPAMNGFDVVKNLQADLTPLIVFATAYEQYALDAFDVNAVDYIVKPIDMEHIQRAVGRAIQRASGAGGLADTKRNVLDALQQIEEGSASEAMMSSESNSQRMNAEEEPQKSGKIVVRDRDTINLIEQEDISWVDAAGDYMCIHAKGETFIMRSTMSALVEQLDENVFKRVHRSTIVNLKHIKQIFPHTKGECFLLIGEHDRIKVSRSYRDVIKDFLAKV